MRVANWQLAMAARIDDWMARPFEYGNADCCQFAADLVLAITGEDHRKSFQTYVNEAEASGMVAAHGGMVALLSSVLGEPVHISRAGVGDVVCIDGGTGEMPMICCGVYSVGKGKRGLVFLPTAQALAGWNV